MCAPEDGNAVLPKGAGPNSAEERHFIDYLRVLSKRTVDGDSGFPGGRHHSADPDVHGVPLYEASGQLLIEADTQNVVTFKAVVEQDAATLEFYQTQYQILESRALARVTIDALKLWNHPEFGGRRRQGRSAVDRSLNAVRARTLVSGGRRGAWLAHHD